MLSAMVLIGEALSLLKPGITLGVELYNVFDRAREIAESPTPATQDELAAFKATLDEQKARLDANTAEIEKD